MCGAREAAQDLKYSNSKYVQKNKRDTDTGTGPVPTMRRPALTAEHHAEGIVEFHSTSPEPPMTGRSVLLALARRALGPPWRHARSPHEAWLACGRRGAAHHAAAPDQGNASRALCALVFQSTVTAAAVYAALGAHMPKSGHGPVCDVSVISLLLFILWCVCACVRACDTRTACAL